MAGSLHERRPMATGTMVAIGSLVLSLLVVAGGLIATYGAWSRSEGERAAYERITSKQLETLQTAKDSAVIKLAVIERDQAEREHQGDALINKFDEYRAYVQALTVRVAESGVRNLPLPPK
jgi:hypothetical protein